MKNIYYYNVHSFDFIETSILQHDRAIVPKSIVLVVLRHREQLPLFGASLDPLSLNETVPNPLANSYLYPVRFAYPDIPVGFSQRTTNSVVSLLHFGEQTDFKQNALLL